MAIAVAFLVADPRGRRSSTPPTRRIVTTPALGIPNVWRAAALPVGCALMLVFALLRLARVGGLGRSLLALAVIAAIGVGPLARQAAC